MLVHRRIVIGVPSEITQVEKRAVMDSAIAPSQRSALVEQAMVAAIGAGITDTNLRQHVVDIGVGHERCGVISLSGIVYSRSCGCRN